MEVRPNLIGPLPPEDWQRVVDAAGNEWSTLYVTTNAMAATAEALVAVDTLGTVHNFGFGARS